MRVVTADASAALIWRSLLAEPEHVAEQVVGHVGQPGVVHHQGDGYLLAHSLLDAAPQFDGHQRIHAEVEEPRVLADLRGIDARHLRHRVAQVIGQKLLALLHRSVGEPLDQLGLPGRQSRAGAAVGHLALQLRQECPPARLLVERQEAGPVDPGHDPLTPCAEDAATTSARPASASAGDNVRTPR